MTTPPASAMILAAGRGERMRPLTDDCPKPLLEVHGRPLIEYPMEALARGGFEHQVVNVAWQGRQIVDRFGKAPQLGQTRPQLRYSDEAQDFGGALETAGGIVRALPWLAPIFWVVAADAFVPGFAFTRDAVARFEGSGLLAHLWLVPNPSHHPGGDFGIDATGLALDGTRLRADAPRHTFSTIGLYRQALFEPPFCDLPAGNPEGIKAALAPILRRAMAEGRVGASLYEGEWTDVGTPKRLAALNA